MRKHHGEIHTGKTAWQEVLANANLIITVGDIVTFNLLKNGIIPHLAVVDGKTRRTPATQEIINGTHHPIFQIETVENPPAMITQELLDAIHRALTSPNPTKIIVKGEDDLAALPAVIMAPISSAVLYGLPEEGAVVVRVTQEKKKEIQSLLDRMKCP